MVACAYWAAYWAGLPGGCGPCVSVLVCFVLVVWWRVRCYGCGGAAVVVCSLVDASVGVDELVVGAGARLCVVVAVVWAAFASVVAAFPAYLLHVLAVEDVVLLCRVVPLPWWLFVVSAFWLRLLRCLGGGSNICRCVKCDQCVDVEGGDGWSGCGW